MLCSLSSYLLLLAIIFTVTIEKLNSYVYAEYTVSQWNRKHIDGAGRGGMDSWPPQMSTSASSSILHVTAATWMYIITFN